MKNTDKPVVFDYLNTADGYEIYWLHDLNDNTVDPDCLYYDKYQFMDACQHIVTDGRPYKNYAIDKSDIARWEDIREEIEKYHREEL